MADVCKSPCAEPGEGNGGSGGAPHRQPAEAPTTLGRIRVRIRFERDATRLADEAPRFREGVEDDGVSLTVGQRLGERLFSFPRKTAVALAHPFGGLCFDGYELAIRGHGEWIGRLPECWLG